MQTFKRQEEKFMSKPTVISDEEMATLLDALGVPELPPEIAKLASEADEATIWHSITGQMLLICQETMAILHDAGVSDPRMLNILGCYARTARLLLTVLKPNTRFSAALDAQRDGVAGLS